jgi:iron complex transport system ATP-binding protein
VGIAISLKNGAFSYGSGKEIFTDLNLDVYDGEVFCILGPNGCGKTTLLSCLNSTLKLTNGHVFLRNQDMGLMKSDEVARKVGFVFQDHAISFPFSVLEVVRMGRAPHLGFFSSPSKEDTEIALNALETVGMFHLKDKPYTQLSGGEMQLVFIARTLAQQPEVVLLDEPTSHLDFRNQVLVLRMVGKLAEKGLTVIMSSHLPDHAFLYSSKVALMKEGRFLGVGKPEEVMTDESLSRTYGLNVRILSVDDSKTGTTRRFVIPKETKHDIPTDEEVLL